MNVLLSLLDYWCRSWHLHLHTTGELPQPSIVAMWHDEMLPVWRFFAPSSPVALVSQSRDGLLLAQLLQRWNYTVIYGSRHRGGKEALHILEAFARSRTVLLTPDGSRGPRHRFKPGAVVLAYRTQQPLILCRIRASGWRFRKSWDHFLLPYPFTTVHLFCSPPLSIPPQADRSEIDGWITRCEQWLNSPPEQLPQCAV